DFLIERRMPDGSLDPTFGSAGRAVIDIIGTDDEARQVILTHDGALLVCGTSNKQSPQFSDSPVSTVAAVVKLSADGKLDPTFGSDGRFVYLNNDDLDDDAEAVLELSDGKILLGSYRDYPGVGVLLRLSSDGKLDQTFGTGGAKTLDGGGIVELLPTSNGKVIVAQEHRLSRLTVGGAVDPKFGSTIDGSIFHLLALRGGKFASPGQATNSQGYIDYAVFRFNSDGTIDSGFGHDGIATLPPNGNSRGPEALAAQADGKLVGLGTDGAVRFNTDGSLDTTFGAG